MGESIILSTPLLWLLYGLALTFCIFDKLHRATKGTFTAISAVLVVVASAAALILGATMGEVVTILLIVLLMGLEGWK